MPTQAWACHAPDDGPGVGMPSARDAVLSEADDGPRALRGMPQVV